MRFLFGLIVVAFAVVSVRPAAAQFTTGAPPPACLGVKQSTRIEQFTLNVWPVVVIANTCGVPYALSFCRQVSKPGVTPKLGECADTTGDDVEVLAGPARVPNYVLPGQIIQMDAWPMETAYATCEARPPGPDKAATSRLLGPYELSPSCPLSPTGRFAAWADPALNSRWREDASAAGRWVQPAPQKPARR